MHVFFYIIIIIPFLAFTRERANTSAATMIIRFCGKTLARAIVSFPSRARRIPNTRRRDGRMNLCVGIAVSNYWRTATISHDKEIKKTRITNRKNRSLEKKQRAGRTEMIARNVHGLRRRERIVKRYKRKQTIITPRTRYPATWTTSV